MLNCDLPNLNLAIASLNGDGDRRYAIWVLQAPHAGGYAHYDCQWSEDLARTWQDWQDLFSVQPLPLPSLPQPAVVGTTDIGDNPSPPLLATPTPTTGSYSSRLMQGLGLQLWQWLFSGSIQRSFVQSQGIALGRQVPLRLRLDVRDPALIGLPWEIAQPRLGKPAVSLAQNILFSRTTCDVEPLVWQGASASLQILLVLGQGNDERASALDLAAEAQQISEIFSRCSRINPGVPYRVDTLIQPTPAELIDRLKSHSYNIFLYAGHGVPAPDGGKLFLRPDTTLSGTELAQVLVRSQVTLAVLNACWGAQSDCHEGQLIPRSSLAEVLIHHGVPAALAMRDAIADGEALSFVRAFAQALAEGHPIDRAVGIARQQLLTLYKFNQPAWTLPVLYLHPEFDGYLLESAGVGVTELPENSPTRLGRLAVNAYLQEIEGDRTWYVRRGLMRIGRTADNDAVISERWVSQRHAEIFVRHLDSGSPSYFLRDFSRYGTLVCDGREWRKIHHQEISLTAGTQLKFGSSQGQLWQFDVE